ncbi:MAG TPA: type II toxin-antitoxin system RatA family toxin [Acidocella sp.]|nr:type II toxin-antitoxin system RatA family toxin [Acidocella sp.]
MDYPAAALFALVADVEAYPNYMPGWHAARVLERGVEGETVEQVVSIAGIRVKFISLATFEPPHRLTIEADGVLFRQFQLVWSFTKLAAARTLVGVEMKVTFRSAVLDRMASRVMPDVLGPVISALERRAALKLGATPPVNSPAPGALPRKDGPQS